MFGTLLLIGAQTFAGPAPRWLRLCDKGPGLEKGTRAWEDAPLRGDLLDSVRSAGWTIRNQFKWENLVSAIPGPGARLPACVEDAGSVAAGRNTPLPSGVAPRLQRSAAAARAASVDDFTAVLRDAWDSLGIGSAQTELAAKGQAPGNGIRVAFMDGFFDRTNPVLQGASIVDAWDFVDNTAKPWDTTGYNMHGTQTSGLVASSWDRLPGIAPNAKLLLYRTENDTSETVAEEDNLAAAIVRATDAGAQVISTSLGYRWVDVFDKVPMHPDSFFDGRHLVASLAATRAAQRNVVVVVSAGNEAVTYGARSIDSPADADLVLTVGAVDLQNRRCGFSSYGPTYDGRTKPDVVAYGCSVPVAAFGGTRMWGMGTSYSAPIVAGMAVLARQLFPGLSAVDLVQAFRASGRLADSVNATTGWGVPSLARLGNLPSVTGSKPVGGPVYWSGGTVNFWSPPAQSGHVGVEMLDLQGRRLLRRDEPVWKSGMLQVWDPSVFYRWKLRTVVVRWWGDYGEGATKFVIHP